MKKTQKKTVSRKPVKKVDKPGKVIKKNFTFKFSERIIKAAKKAAEAQNRSLSNFIEVAIQMATAERAEAA